MEQKTKNTWKSILAIVCFTIITWALIVTAVWWAGVIDAISNAGAIIFFSYVMVQIILNYIKIVMNIPELIFPKPESDFKELKKEIRRRKR